MARPPSMNRRRAAARVGTNTRFLEPNMAGYLGREMANFRTLLRQRQFNQADISWRKYQCASGAGFHTVNGGTETDQCSKLVSSAVGRTTFKPGSTVLVGSHTGDRKQVILGYPPPGQRGTSSFPRLQAQSGLSAFSIVSASPDLIGEDAETDSTITGFGFDGTEVFDCVVYNVDTLEYEADPYVTVIFQTYVNTTTWVLKFSSISGTPIGHKVTVRATRE